MKGTIEIRLVDGSFITVPLARNDKEALNQLHTLNITDASHLQLRYVYRDLLYGDVRFTDVIVRRGGKRGRKEKQVN